MQRLSGTLGLSLFLLAASIATAHAGPIAPRASCEPTQPNGYTPPGHQNSPNNHGADGLGVNLWTAVAGAGAWRYDPNARAVGIKYGWFTPENAKPTITGRRIDAPAPLLVVDIAGLAWDGFEAFFPSLLYFPTRGCWQIVATAGGASMTFVVEVSAGPEVWTPPRAAPAPRVRVWGPRNVTFVWASRADCRTFAVAMRRGSGNWRVVVAAASTTEYALERAALNVRYAVRLRCRDMFGSGEWGPAAIARVRR